MSLFAKHQLKRKQPLLQPDSAGYMYIRWHWKDVLALDDCDVPLTQADCEAILSQVVNAHDPQDGINWDIILEAIYKYRGET